MSVASHFQSFEDTFVVMFRYIPVGFLSHSLSVRLIPAGAWVDGVSAVLYTFKISIALAIRSFDPLRGF